jgi:DNA-directed RNA polymerase specialized sigma24 family protein
MADASTFHDLIIRLRTGDAGAAAELVRRYEPTIRLIVRRRLSDPALRRVLDSMDICQSVLASFFLRAAVGQYQLDDPQQLLKLLATMARNKVLHEVARQRAAGRKPAARKNGRSSIRRPAPVKSSPTANCSRSSTAG